MEYIQSSRILPRVMMKVILRRQICLSGKIATLVFGKSVDTATQGKQKRNVCVIKK